MIDDGILGLFHLLTQQNVYDHMEETIKSNINALLPFSPYKCNFFYYISMALLIWALVGNLNEMLLYYE